MIKGDFSPENILKLENYNNSLFHCTTKAFRDKISKQLLMGFEK